MTIVAEPAAPALGSRNAFQDMAGVRSRCTFSGADHILPEVTIAILTHRRPDMLVHAVASAIDQRSDRPIEIIVVDNDPESAGAEDLLRALPRLAELNFRYWVNDANLGMYPNHNRAIELARGNRVSLLHDDDLLDPGFVETLSGLLDRRPDVRGLVSRKRNSDERGSLAASEKSRLRRLAARLLLETYFVGGAVRRLTLRKLFWAPAAGNVAGFLFHRDAALQIGGFYPEDELSADHYFYCRFARTFGLWQHRTQLATVRIARNESAKPSTLLNFIAQSIRLKRALVAAGDVPRTWAAFVPMMVARQRAEYCKFWHLDVGVAAAEKMLGARLPPDRPLLFRALRFALRAF